MPERLRASRRPALSRERRPQVPLRAFENANLARHAVAERRERFLIRRAVVRGDCLGHAVEFEDHRALGDAFLVQLDGHPPRDEATAGRDECGTGKLRVGRELVLIVHRLVDADPIRFRHPASFPSFARVTGPR